MDKDQITQQQRWAKYSKYSYSGDKKNDFVQKFKFNKNPESSARL
jgi:hypothetical protein